MIVKFFLCCAIAVLTLTNAVAEQKNTFVAGSFSFAKGHKGASYSEIIIGKALAEYGYHLEVEYYPGRRLMAQLNTGAIDGDMGRMFNMARGFDNIIRVDEPISRPCALLYRLDSRSSSDMRDPENPIKIGVFAGAPGGATAILRRWPSAVLVEYENFKQGAQMLMNNRIDLVSLGDKQVQQLIAEVERPISIEDIFYLPPVYMHVHKRHSELAVRLSGSIKLLKRKYPSDSCHIEGD